MMTLQDLVTGTRGELKHSSTTSSAPFTGLTIDSRKDVTGQIFVALKGDAHDGHKFLKDVVAKGVGAVVSHEWDAELAKKTTWVQVPDTLQALQDLSNFWRHKWGKTVLSVTGSNGKTSVKDFAQTLLSGSLNSLKSEGSFNNHWGLPLTLLNLRAEHDVAMVEMGMNHAGEITRLCEIADPDVALVNNIGRAHIGHFGSIEGIAQAKEEIYHGLRPSGTAIFNLADPFTTKMHAHLKSRYAKVMTFGTPSSDVHFELIKSDMGGLRLSARIFSERAEVIVPVWGEHNVMNLAAAASLAFAAEVSPAVIFQQLEKCRLGWGRNQWVQLKSGATVLFDGYNANPDSFKALLQNAKKSLSPDLHVIAVFGEMREQGEAAPQEHRDLGYQTALSPIQECYFIGESAAEFKAGFDSAGTSKKLVISDSYKDSLASTLQSMLTTKTLVLVKGSRGGALERVVTGLDPLDFTTK